MKIPAPLLYSKKAAMLMGRKLAKGPNEDAVKISENFNEIMSMFYV
jgi:hypothetical protein